MSSNVYKENEAKFEKYYIRFPKNHKQIHNIR